MIRVKNTSGGQKSLLWRNYFSDVFFSIIQTQHILRKMPQQTFNKEVICSSISKLILKTLFEKDPRHFSTTIFNNLSNQIKREKSSKYFKTLRRWTLLEHILLELCFCTGVPYLAVWNTYLIGSTVSYRRQRVCTEC